MIHSFTRIASFVLAFGFFISCSSLQSSTENSDSPTLSERQLKQQIDSLDKQISSNPNSADLHYQRGSLLTKLAQKQSNPTQRTSPYTEAYQALTKATDLYTDSSNPESEKVQELLKVTWSIEHNQGVKILQSDGTNTPNYKDAAAHFHNATIVIPDSAISYRMQARAFYKDQQPDQAISVLEKARQNVDGTPPTILEQLAFLYLENDQPQKAVTIYEEAESFSDQNLNLLHGLSNAYINAGEHQKAVELLEQLIESKPENIIYGQTLATELYFIADQHLKTVDSNLRAGNKLGDTKFGVADSLLNRSEGQFQKILDANPEDQNLKESVARFYHNAASKYQQLLPFIDQVNKQQLEDKIKNYLSSSIPLLEQLAEKDPDNKRIWHNLYQAYSYLGMESEARKAKSNL